MDFKNSIIRETASWVAINKPKNVSVQPDKTNDKSLVDYASEYFGTPGFVINRIDRPVTGMVLIGKNAITQEKFRDLFARRLVKKYYLAITKDKPAKDRDKLHNFIWKKERINKSFIERESQERTKDAYLFYQYLKSIEKYHLLKIKLITGRHHQIRAQLAYINCPIRGDVKYGYPRANRVHSIQLHAWKLYFKDPDTQEHVWLYAPPPDENIWNAFDVAAVQSMELQKYGRTEKN